MLVDSAVAHEKSAAVLYPMVFSPMSPALTTQYGLYIAAVEQDV